jgi:hypothetical protein
MQLTSPHGDAKLVAVDAIHVFPEISVQDVGHQRLEHCFVARPSGGLMHFLSVCACGRRSTPQIDVNAKRDTEEEEGEGEGEGERHSEGRGNGRFFC